MSVLQVTAILMLVLRQLALLTAVMHLSVFLEAFNELGQLISHSLAQNRRRLNRMWIRRNHATARTSIQHKLFRS